MPNAQENMKVVPLLGSAGFAGEGGRAGGREGGREGRREGQVEILQTKREREEEEDK